MNCVNCGKEIEQADSFDFWRHVTSRLYGCGRGAQYGGKMAEPDCPEEGRITTMPELLRETAKKVGFKP